MRIFNLIPGVRTTWSGVLTTIILPESLTEENLSRFHLYGSFINILEVSIRHGPAPSKLYHWLFAYSRTRPLLPKLQTLAFISRDRLWGHSLTPLSTWLTLFLSPSLLHFQLPTLTSQLGTYFILRSLARICPNLRTLDFFSTDRSDTLSNPQKDEWNHQLSNAETSTHHDLNPLFARLRYLISLRTHRKVLESLSPDALPRLEWLDVLIPHDSSSDVGIPYTLLTSLKHVGIFKCADKFILETLPASAVTLTSVEIGSRLNKSLVRQVTARLAMYCPFLTDLSLNIVAPPIKADLAPLALIAPLRRLYVIHSDSISPAYQSNVFSYIKDLLPGLKSLELRYGYTHR
ncbi:hypothetical protein FRC12_013318 [Ceratobasidium sp. 428]|nr:hypothetical protein FRC12_013318 [Ceratobasidium sp. 428]